MYGSERPQTLHLWRSCWLLEPARNSPLETSKVRGLWRIFFSKHYWEDEKYQVTQGPDELPSGFLERLCDTNWVFTHIDPDAPQNKQATVSTVVMQLAPDVR